FHRESRLSRSLAEGIILRQRPPAVPLGYAHRFEVRHQNRREPLIADRQLQLLANRFEHFSANVREAEPAVANLGEPAVLAEADALGSRQEFAGELPWPLFGIEAAAEG